MNPTRFTVTTSWYECIKDFDDDLRLEIYDAIFKYASTHEIPKLSKIGLAAFQFIKMDIDVHLKRAEAISEARKKAGAAGGNKRSQKTSKPKQDEQ